MKILALMIVTLALFIVDVASGQATSVDTSKGGEIREYAFSPDSKWLAYTTPRNGMTWGAGAAATISGSSSSSEARHLRQRLFVVRN